jgi:hypothetical protein
MTGFHSKRAAAADKLQEPWNEDEWRRNNWRCGHGWLRGEQCEICNAPQPAQEPVAKAWNDGYKAGVADERTSEANIGIAGFGAKIKPARQNPYGVAQPAQEPVLDLDGHVVRDVRKPKKAAALDRDAEIERLNEKIEFLARSNMLYSDWEHRDAQVTSDLIRKGIEASKLNVELLFALTACLDWMEQLRTSGDAGNWDWEDDAYTKGRAIEAKLKEKNNGT